MGDPAARSGGEAPVLRVRSPVHCLALAGLSAAMLGLSYPEPGWGWLAHVALVPLGLLALRVDSAWRLAWTSALVMFAWWLVMLRWLWPVTGGGYAMLAAFMALYTPCTLLVFRRLVRGCHLPAVLALPLALVSLELLRGLWPAGGFAWFALGHSQAPFRPDQGASRLVQVADLFGEHAVSFLVAMTSGMLIDVLPAPGSAATAAGRRPRGPVASPVVWWAAAIGGAWLYGTWRIAPTSAAAPELAVLVVQTNVPQSNKDSRRAGQIERDWQDLLGLTRRAAAGSESRPQLVVWPETMVPGPLNAEALAHARANAQDSSWRPLVEQREAITALTSELAVHLLAGAPAWIPADPPRRRNSVYHFDPTGGQDPRRYDKMHRVPFGEYVPWVDAWPWAKSLFIRYLTPYDFDYTIEPGTTRTVFAIPGRASAAAAGPPAARLVTPICFEDTVARVCRRLCYGPGGVKRADLLVNLTNDAWYCGPQRPQHLQIATLRSVENRVPTVRSVNTGVSGFIDAAGRIQASIAEHTAGSAAQSVVLDRRSTLFGRLGQGPALLVGAATLILAAGGGWWRSGPGGRRRAVGGARGVG